MARPPSLLHRLPPILDPALPTSAFFSNLLQCCITTTSTVSPQLIHARILKTHFSSETFILNRLIGAYAKSNNFTNARKLFDTMPHRNKFTYNTMIAACTKSGFIAEAELLFRSMSEPDQCTWNTVVSGFAQQGFSENALVFFARMHGEDFVVGAHSFSSALSACAGLMEYKMGIQIHALVAKSPLVCNVYMGSALVDMYSKCRQSIDAQKVFEGMPERNVVSWNSLITCFEQNGPVGEALVLFVRMMDSGVGHDEMTLASMVSACASLAAIREGMQIHARAVKFDKFRDDLVLNNALVDMYAKCRRITEARRVFDRMPRRSMVSETSMITGYVKSANVQDARLMFRGMTERNIVAWNALIAGYTQNQENGEALRLFLLLKREPVWPSHYTFANILNVCANLTNLDLGRQTHVHVLKHGFRFVGGHDSDIFVGNSLVDMYLKC